MKEPVFVAFDIDGTFTGSSGVRLVGDRYSDARLEALPAIPNMVAIAKQYLATENVQLMFCTGRPKRSARVTWQWLNRHLQLSESGKVAILACRPDNISDDHIAMFKAIEYSQAIRRLGSKPSEALIFDSSVANLQMFATLRPMVHRLRLYKVEDGIATQWNL
jgi:hypothetical protein